MSEALVALYAPYCQGMARRQELQRALELLAVGSLQGERRLRPSGARRFRLSWSAVSSPLEQSTASLRFEDGPDLEPLEYSFELPTFRLVLWLMDWLAAGGGPTQSADLPDSFWRWLILGLDPAAVAA
jgi:hypothetical protein